MTASSLLSRFILLVWNSFKTYILFLLPQALYQEDFQYNLRNPSLKLETLGLGIVYLQQKRHYRIDVVTKLHRWITAFTKIKFVEKYIPRMNAGLEKATPSAMPVQPRTRAGLTGRHRAKQ